jgi:hypothetical protein
MLYTLIVSAHYNSTRRGVTAVRNDESRARRLSEEDGMDAMTIDVDSIKNVIRTYKEQGQATVTTVEVIQEYHLNNRKAVLSASTRSFNSLFGKLLRENEADLGIRYVREVILHDSDIQTVQSAEWVIL